MFLCGRHLHSFGLGILFTTLALRLPAQELKPTAPQELLAAMCKRADTLKLAFPHAAERSAKLLETPVLRCNDPTREEMDGAVWLWLEGKRPVAAVCLLFYKKGRWNYELVSLTDEAVEVTGRPAWTWQPKATLRTWLAMEGKVPEAPRGRQLALRAVARQFEASEMRRGERYPLRLLDRPIYTYSAPDEGLIEGAIFALSYGTNPEALVQIEAREAEGRRGWHASFARLSGAEVTVRLGEKEVWKVEPLDGDAAYVPDQPYFAAKELNTPE
jgi:hypothetical protein